MDAKQFLAFQLDDAGYQLDKCFDGISEEALNLKVCTSAMTPKEICVHLGDVYSAFVKMQAGEKHEWGSFKLNDDTWPAAWLEVKSLRNSASAAAKNVEGDDGQKMVNAYILGHDYYHVGQICLARVQTEPDFDPYSIYPA